MRIRFSFFNTHTKLGLTLLLFFSPNYASSDEHFHYGKALSAGHCANAAAASLSQDWQLPKGAMTSDEADKWDEGNKKSELATGEAAAVCELMFGASVWDSLSPMQQGFGSLARLKKLDSYKALMTADKITQQALVKDYLKNWFGMDAEGISAGMAQLAAQRKKQEEQEEKEKEAAKKKALADDAFAVFDIPAEEARAAIKRAAADAVNKQLKNGGNIDTKQMNTQTYVDENGNKGTLWCNPGPCTLGSALRHGWISGAGTFLPEELVDAATKVLMTDSETSSSAIRSEIFNITLKTIKEAAETSADPKLKSAAAMTATQIKSNQVANEKSQEDKSGNLVEVEEAPEDKAPIEEVPVEEAPVEEAPVEEAPVEEAPVEEAPVEEAPAEEAPVEEAPVEEAPVEEAPVEEDHHHDDGTEAPVDEGTEAPVEEWDDDCLGMDQCNIPIEG